MSGLEISRSPEVAEYFHVFGDRIAEGVSAELASQVTELYEDNQLIVFDSPGLQADWKLLQSVSYPESRDFKKLRNGLLTEPLWKDAARGILKRGPSPLAQIFGWNVMESLRFKREAKRLQKQVDKIVRSLFPNYRFVESEFHWRFCETAVEDLHYDSHHDAPEYIDHHWLRVFVNLDSAPRVWNVSHRLPELMRMESEKARNLDHAKFGSGEYVRRFSNEVFGGMKRAGKDGFSRHVCNFPQGAIWFANTRTISHQIYYGRRALSASYIAEPASMRNPEKAFTRLVDEERKRFRG